MASPSKKPKKTLIDVEGYITFVSSPRKTKRWEKDFIEISINSATKTLRGLCYDKDRSPQFTKFKEENKSCLIVKAELSNKDDIIIGHDTTIKSKEVDFENKTHEPPTVTMEQVINECSLYQRVTIVGKLINLKPAAFSVFKRQHLREGVFIDTSTFTRPITFFNDDLIEIVKENIVYKITNVVISTYGGKKNLQVSENSVITEMEDPGIDVPVADTNSVSGIISMIETNTLDKQFHCKICDNIITPNAHQNFECCGKTFTDLDVNIVENVTFMLRSNTTNNTMKFACPRKFLDALVGDCVDDEMFINFLLKKAVNIEYTSNADSCNVVVKIESGQTKPAKEKLW
ncbi:uncharacterized protein [Clytia hemisphaerica]|uniref:Uncharacterized protein n=1 Tax=Clytia hemisphaerica TaxID=252671 RepID=A0A7M5XFN4_9CNID|eukprot:TCONS_00027106-protein